MAKLTFWQNGISGEIEFQAPAKLQEVLQQHGIFREQPCGGKGICGKCRVTVSGCVSEPDPTERQWGVRLSCRTVLLGDSRVWLEEDRSVTEIMLSGKENTGLSGSGPNGQFGAAVDVGTTTLALKVFDLETGECIARCGGENPQRSVAADVMGRIQAALEGKGPLLRQQVSGALEAMLEEAGQKAGIPPERIEMLSVVGNTAMLYLLTGQCPRSLGAAPFLPEDLFGREVKLLGRRAWLCRCMNGFVGGDITAAVLSCGMCDSEETSLLCDIGTNGELALWKDRTLFVCSTAAGPAFEGAGISCGCGSIPGAVDRVWVESGEICIHTIRELPPAGICGSGLLDAAAVFLRLGLMDETGALEQDSLPVGGELQLLRKDIRALQLAKAAIAAGMETLMAKAGIAAEDVKTLYIAGGFGSHLNIDSAVSIGLIPEVLREKVCVLGNAALAGAVQMLSDEGAREKAKKIAHWANHISLGGDPVFNGQFLEHMLFPSF